MALASKVMHHCFHGILSSCCSHRSVIIQCGRILHKAWISGGHLSNWLPHLCPRKASLSFFLEFAQKNKETFFPKNLQTTFFLLNWSILKLESVARIWDWAKLSLCYIPHYWGYTGQRGMDTQMKIWMDARKIWGDTIIFPKSSGLTPGTSISVNTLVCMFEEIRTYLKT